LFWGRGAHLHNLTRKYECRIQRISEIRRLGEKAAK
jgi:hypothetical protein